MTQSSTLPVRPRVAPFPVFIDLMGRDRVRRMVLMSGLAAALVVYMNVLGNGFVLDDGGTIVRNPVVTSPAAAWRAFTLPYWPDAIGGGQYRPLGILSFALDWQLSGGDPRWFHAVNVFWHAAATLLVGWLACELLAPVAAGVATILFAVHPVHVEAVSNVVGRLEPMSTVCVLGALLAHRRSSYWAPVFFALALLCKESAIVLLGLAVVNDLVLERDWRAALRSRRLVYAGYAGVALVYAATLAAVFRDRAFRAPARALAGVDTFHRLEIVARVIPHYVRLLIAPADLSASYAPNVISPAAGVSPGTALGVALVAVSAIALTVVLRHRRWPVVAFSLVWIPVALAPVSNVLFSSGVVLAERTLYLASVGACLAAGAAAERFLVPRWTMVAAATASVVLAFAIRTWTRTPAWRDDRTYLLTLLADHPEAYDAHLTAGRVLKGGNSLEEADRELVIARTLFPRDSVVFLEAADVSQRRQHPELAAALRDSARLAHTLPLPRP
ncbi:MAG TPA: hypothetical protein VL308_02335 [Gemmatimonadaceae bacterium]|nr:hypothetical protein [Gemmatimonadaceae bacterium]